jgi:hypothetical protein
MAETNGTPVIIPEQAEREPYRPIDSTREVHNTIVESLSDIVHSSANQAYNFMRLFAWYDKHESPTVRHGHLVDAQECLEIALTHLVQLKAAVSYRLLIEDEQDGTPRSN